MSPAPYPPPGTRGKSPVSRCIEPFGLMTRNSDPPSPLLPKPLLSLPPPPTPSRPRVAEVGERLQRLKQAQTVLRPLKTQLDGVLAPSIHSCSEKALIQTGQTLPSVDARLAQRASPQSCSLFLELHRVFPTANLHHKFNSNPSPESFFHFLIPISAEFGQKS